MATSTYRVVELAALVLEGKPLGEAVQEADQAWTGSLAEDHLRAIELLTTERAALKQTMAGHLTPNDSPITLRSPGTNSSNWSAPTPQNSVTSTHPWVSCFTRKRVSLFTYPTRYGIILIYVKCT